MSTNTRVLRSFTGMTVTPVNGNAINVISVMDLTINDATGEIKTISDNDTSYKKFNQPGEFTGSIDYEDPVQGQAVSLKNNCAVAFQAIDINTNANVNVTMTGVRFGQVGLRATSGQQGRPSQSMSGGGVNYA